MSKKIDDLFTPNRLRKLWQQTQTGAGMPEGVETEGGSPIEIYDRLRFFINERFSGDDVVALNQLLDDLHNLLVRLLPKEGEKPGSEEYDAEAIPAAHELLSRIEDLVEVFEMAGRSSGNLRY
jgi:hypothetical protein